MNEEKLYNAISGIDEDLTDRSLKRKPQSKTKKLTQAVTCLVSVCIVLCLAFVGIPKLFPSTDNPSVTIGYTKQTITLQKCSDKFSTKGLLGDGTFGDSSANRLLYLGIHFYDSNEKTYMFFDESRNIYEFDGDAFQNTGVHTAENLFSTYSVSSGYAYVGGIFHCVGGMEKGLFKLDLASGSVAKVIDSDEIVSSILVDGTKIYYSSYRKSYSFGDGITVSGYALKCADTKQNEIQILCESDTYISGLRMMDGDLYYMTGHSVCWISPDQTLHTVSTGETVDFINYAVCNNNIYVYNYAYSFDEQGNRIRISDIFVYSAKSGTQLKHITRNDLYFTGSSCDGFTVYDGKVAAFDKNGMYLLDVMTGECETIASVDFVKEASAWTTRPEQYYEGISKTVHNGRLYFNYGTTVMEYGADGVSFFEVNY